MTLEHTLPVAAQNNNIIRLSLAQALAGANSVVFYATGAIVGNAIAPSGALSTLPITIFVWHGRLHSSFWRTGEKKGRKAAFMVGTGPE